MGIRASMPRSLQNHLVLKAFHRPEGTGVFEKMADQYWRALRSSLPPEFGWLEGAAMRHLGCLLLARVDGKSPAEYLRDAAVKQRVREGARALILIRRQPPPRGLRDSLHEAADQRAARPWRSWIREEIRRWRWRRSYRTGQSPRRRFLPELPTGRHEAHELRDGEAERYEGRGVRGAASRVERGDSSQRARHGGGRSGGVGPATH